MKTLQVWITGFASLMALAACQPLQAAHPIYFAGVVGEPQIMLTTQGESYVFPENARPTFASVLASPFGASTEFAIGGSLDANGNYDVMTIFQTQPTTEPTFLSATVDLSDGTTIVGTQEISAVVFSTAAHRDAFLYYLQQKELATTYEDNVYFSALVWYEFFMGQEDEGLALYYYYTGLGDYYYLITVEENQQNAEYYYYYYRGFGAYYYFEGLGDLESANLAFAYHLSLANAALAE